jgi:hypothetical protein
MNKKIINLNKNYSIEDSDFYRIDFDVLLYWYQYGDWEGRGFAIWRNDGKWSYTSLGHCSCYGPTEDIVTANNAKFDLNDIKKILANEDYSGGSVILKYINSKKYV